MLVAMVACLAAFVPRSMASQGHHAVVSNDYDSTVLGVSRVSLAALDVDWAVVKERAVLLKENDAILLKGIENLERQAESIRSKLHAGTEPPNDAKGGTPRFEEQLHSIEFSIRAIRQEVRMLLFDGLVDSDEYARMVGQTSPWSLLPVHLRGDGIDAEHAGRVATAFSSLSSDDQMVRAKAESLLAEADSSESAMKIRQRISSNLSEVDSVLRILLP